MAVNGYQILQIKQKLRERYEILVVKLEDVVSETSGEIVEELTAVINKTAKLKELEDIYNASVFAKDGYTINEALKRKKLLHDVSYQLRGYHSGRSTFIHDKNRQDLYLHLRSVIVKLEEFISYARTINVDMDLPGDLADE